MSKNYIHWKFSDIAKRYDLNESVIRRLIIRAKNDMMSIVALGTFLLAASIKGFHIKWWYLVLFGMAFLSHILWSHFRGVRQDTDYTYKKSREFQELRTDVKKIIKELEEIKEKL